MSDWVTLAGIVRPRGNRGEVVVHDLTTGPARFLELRQVTLLGDGGKIHSEAEVEDAWDHQGQTVLKFRGIDSISDAEAIQGLEVAIPISRRRALEAGEYFYGDLVNCRVVDAESGREYGRVAVVHEQAGGHGLLELENEILIPFVKEICIDIRPADGVIRVRLPEGLADL